MSFNRLGIIQFESGMKGKLKQVESFPLLSPQQAKIDVSCGGFRKGENWMFNLVSLCFPFEA